MTETSDGGPLQPVGDGGPGVEPTRSPEPDETAARPASGADDAPRISTFSLDGRAVPALYLGGWVATLLGAALLSVALMAGRTPASPWLFLVGLVILGLGLISAGGSQAVERGRRPDLAYRGPSPVLAFLVVVVLTVIGLIVLLAPLSALGLDARSPAATTLNLALTTVLYVGVIRLLVIGPGALTWREMGVIRPNRAAARELLAGVVLAVPVLVVTLLLGGLLALFLDPAPSPLPEGRDILGLVLNLLSAAILAPIGEELFFRGFTTTAWARTWGARSAIARGAVFFALAHVVTLFDVSFETGAQRALFSFVALLPVSVTLGWVFLARRSLYAAIGLHGTFNALQVIVVAVAAGLV